MEYPTLGTTGLHDFILVEWVALSEAGGYLKRHRLEWDRPHFWFTKISNDLD